MTIPLAAIEMVKNTISRYQLLSVNESVIVALSGGKDSLAVLRILKELGHQCFPVVVDMGYSDGWGARVANLAHCIGTEALVIPARSAAFQSALNQRAREDLNSRLVILDALETLPSESASPCTECYNSKVTVLKHEAEDRGIRSIVFGHHATDAIASFLKSALMYIDRFDYGHLRWSRTNFESIIELLHSELAACGHDGRIVSRIGYLATNHLAATDEPPVQTVEAASGDIRIIRPMFNLFEHEIVAMGMADVLTPEPSSCGHGATREKETPREMIHYRLLRNLVAENGGIEWLKFFSRLVDIGLNEDGSLIFNARNERAHLLGKDYRAGAGNKV
jgi:hypothetical protein